MAKEFKLPDPGEGIHEAEILEVYVSEGDEVQEGDIILYIETDKAAVEVPSPFTGVVEELNVQPGDQVTVGEVLMTYTEGARDGKRPKQTEKTARAEEKEEAPSKREAAEEEGEPEGKAERREKEEGEERKQRETQAETPRKSPKAEEAARAERGTGRPVPASPATRRLARELEVNLHDVQGSGPGGRVMTEDVRAAAGKTKEAPIREKAKTEEAREAAPQEREEKAPSEPPETRKPEPKRRHPLAEEMPPLPDFSRWGSVEHIPLRSVRRVTAKQMTLAWSQIPHVTHQDIADITELEAFRQRHQAPIEKQGGKLSLTVLVMQAVVAALKEFPLFNASLDLEAGEIIQKQYYHIGVAVDTERGLLVPVVRDVDRKSIAELAVELVELVERVRKGTIKREELQGGTFTLTNVGPIGGTAFTPLIRYPEVAILGLARARLEPVVQGELDNFNVVPRLRLPLQLAFDHRVNDGADAARFVKATIDILSNPESFVLSI